MSDRTVHGKTANGDEIVRYNRAGKWYLERAAFGREQITFGEAVRLAMLEGSTAILRLPGGARFDAAVHKICETTDA